MNAKNHEQIIMNDLPKSQQPRSDDPDFWAVWVGKDDKGEPVARDIDWSTISADWQRFQLHPVSGALAALVRSL